MKKINDEIIFECYRRMFKEAEPSADFDELHKKGVTRQKDFFMSYFLPSNRIKEICLEVAKENKLGGWGTQALKSICFLGACPNSCRRTWKERQTFQKQRSAK